LQITSKILGLTTIDWRKVIWLQLPGMKSITEEAYEKLKISMINNGFADPFKIWIDDKKIYVLDGFHRRKVLKDLSATHKVPRVLPAVSLKIKNKKEAAKLVLIYSAKYAMLEPDITAQFMDKYKIKIDDMRLELSLAEFDFTGIMTSISNKLFTGRPSIKGNQFDHLTDDEESGFPEDFKNVDPDSLKYEYRCPSCGHEWSGKAK
jgi:hypothetical protein